MLEAKWPYEKVIGKRKVYAKASESEIIVRVENNGDTSKYAEFIYPKLLGVRVAAEHALRDVRDEDILG